MRTINNVQNGAIIEPICLNCDNTYGYNWPDTCKAYPDGIPQEILDGKADHTKPYKNDNGVVFKPTSSVTEEEWQKRLSDLLKDTKL